MTDWGRRAAVAVVGVLAVTVSGCEGPLGPAAVSGDVLAGQWTACLNGGAGIGDYRKTLIFYPDASFLVRTESHATTDKTCGGAATATKYEAWNYRLGNQVAASIGPAGTSVAAREITYMNSLVVIYSIVYTDAAAMPHLLYFGDVALDPALDGTTAAKRPDVLSATTALSSI